MNKHKFVLTADAKSDLINIRQYTLAKWGKAQWLLYKNTLLNSLQNLAENPQLGQNIVEISASAFYFPLKNHVIYYLQRSDDIVVVGIISTAMSPAKHQQRLMQHQQYQQHKSDR